MFIDKNLTTIWDYVQAFAETLMEQLNIWIWQDEETPYHLR